MITIEEGRQLCSAFQWNVVQSSFPDMIKTLMPARLKSNILSVKKFQQDAGNGRAAQLFKETLDRFVSRLRLFESGEQAEIGAFEKESPDKQSFNMHAIEVRVEREMDENRKSNDLLSIAVHGQQQGAKAGERHIQSHIGSSNRRRQATRDSKNR